MTYKPLAPDYVQFYPTLRCDRRCEFCFNGPAKGAEDMPFPSFRRMIDRIVSAGVRSLDIMGGEPTLHQELLAMVEHACAKNMQVNLSSNGRDPNLIAEIMRRSARTTVGISVNDRNAFRDLERFIRKHRPVVKSVAGRSADQGLVQEILSLKPIKFYFLYRDALEPDQLAETTPFDEFVRKACDGPGPVPVGAVFCSGFLPDLEQYPQLRTARCPAGTTKLGVMPDGSVYPCNLFFGREKFRLGNILTDPFDAIWRHPGLAFFRTFTGNRCPRTSCGLHARCHGGCPAHAVAHAGSLSAPEPRCVRK